MKAFLLAAGKGTRLKPYTDTTPKCLIPIHGKPLLGIWFDLLARHGVDEVLVNTHHHAEQVTAFIDRIRHKVHMTIVTAHEPELLGSAGTLWKNRHFVEKENDFIIAYGDNLTNLDLSAMVAFHRNHESLDCILTMGLFHAPDPSACGIAVLNGNNHIIAFTEKPVHPKGDLANSGIYITTPALFDCVPAPGNHSIDPVFDFGYHVLPHLKGKMAGYEINEYLRDIGTIESYEMALKEWR